MSISFAFKAVSAVLLLSPVIVPAIACSQEPAGIAVGMTAPGAAVESLDGKAMDLAQFIGKKPVLMEFWATWCPLCRKLEPQMQTLRKAYGDRVNFVSVGVPQNQTPERQLAHVTREEMGGMFVFDRNSTAIAAYQVPHTSYVVVINAAGKVVYTGVGPDQDLDAALKKALMPPGSRP
ncbi:MAG: TlpA disulfide reductase family protein [Gemmatimonadaceae bacterium]